MHDAHVLQGSVDARLVRSATGVTGCALVQLSHARHCSCQQSTPGPGCHSGCVRGLSTPPASCGRHLPAARPAMRSSSSCRRLPSHRAGRSAAQVDLQHQIKRPADMQGQQARGWQSRDIRRSYYWQSRQRQRKRQDQKGTGCAYIKKGPATCARSNG